MEDKKEGKSVFNSTYVWIITGIVLLLGGWLGLKILLGLFESYRLTFVDSPKEVISGNNAAFTWRIDGPPAVVNHTAIHFGTVSGEGELGKEIKPEDTKYTQEMLKDFSDGKYNIPLQFVGNIAISKPGKYYYRAHTLVKGKNYWSDEYTLEVKKTDWKISVLSAPKDAAVGNNTFTWRIEGPATSVSKTVVYYGLESTSGVLGKEVIPEDTQYTQYVKDFEKGKYDVPLQFVGNTKIASPGAYFYRAHVNIGGQNYWSDEGSFQVK